MRASVLEARSAHPGNPSLILRDIPETLMNPKERLQKLKDLPAAAPAGLCFAGMAPEKGVGALWVLGVGV